MWQILHLVLKSARNYEIARKLWKEDSPEMKILLGKLHTDKMTADTWKVVACHEIFRDFYDWFHA
jgi:hypothetical protein